MKFTMSPNIALISPTRSAAVKFYTEILGFKMRSEDDEMTDIDAHPLNLFIMQKDVPLGPVMELFVDDLEAARNLLLDEGCKILRWKGAGNDCYVQDPFGLIFNLWQK